MIFQYLLHGQNRQIIHSLCSSWWNNSGSVCLVQNELMSSSVRSSSVGSGYCHKSRGHSIHRNAVHDIHHTPGHQEHMVLPQPSCWCPRKWLWGIYRRQRSWNWPGSWKWPCQPLLDTWAQGHSLCQNSRHCRISSWRCQLAHMPSRGEAHHQWRWSCVGQWAGYDP